MVYRCARHLGGRIVLENLSAAESDEYVKRKCGEFFLISPDTAVFRDTLVSLSCPVLTGVETGKKKVLIPFFKRCSGYVLIEVSITKKDLAAFRSLNANTMP
jgi:hypothetical protein